MKKTEKLEMTVDYVLNALRNVGYDNFTAMAEFLDNSIEPKICTKNIYIDVVKSKSDENGYTHIIVSDDGNGMSKNILKAAMCLGTRGKDKKTDLGFYGTGMKTAAMSFGKRLTVFTKTAKSDNVLKAVLDLDEIKEQDKLFFTWEIVTDEKECKFFYGRTRAKHGTVIVVSSLDRMKSNKYDVFCKSLSKEIRILFNKFIENDTYSFYLNGEKLTYFDTIGVKSNLGTELLCDNSFTYDGCDIRYKFWYIPYTTSVDKDGDDFFARTPKNCGIYIYRQNRLVGYGLDLDLIKKRWGWTNGLRVEIFVDGTADTLFGSTYNKMVNDVEGKMNEDFYDKLESIFAPFRELAKVKQKSENNTKNEEDEQTQSVLDKTTEQLNSNKLIGDTFSQKGVNKKTGNSKPKNPNPKQQLNPAKTRTRHGKWFAGFELLDGAAADQMYYVYKKNEKEFMVSINRNHVFYKEFFCKLNAKEKNKFALVLAANVYAEEKTCIGNSIAKDYVNDYRQNLADGVRLLLRNEE